MCMSKRKWKGEDTDRILCPNHKEVIAYKKNRKTL